MKKNMRCASTGIIWCSLVSAAFCQNDPVFRSEARFVTVDVQVLSHNRPVVGLLQKSFLLLDDGVPQTITNFASEDQPLDIMLLVDVSSRALVQTRWTRGMMDRWRDSLRWKNYSRAAILTRRSWWSASAGI